MPSSCRFPACGRPAVTRGLCRGHVRQEQLHPGRELRPLRGPRGQLGAEPLVALPGVRVSRRCLDTLGSVGAASVSAAMRLVLEAWALGAPLSPVAMRGISQMAKARKL